LRGFEPISSAFLCLLKSLLQALVVVRYLVAVPLDLGVEHTALIMPSGRRPPTCRRSSPSL
jgi:hypothetical protein